MSLIVFIDLESEMYQLSHMLTEQRSLLSTLASSCLTPAAPLESPQQESKNEDQRENLLAAIAEKVEGCAVSIIFFTKIIQTVYKK